MSDILCTGCGEVGPPQDGKCAKCGSADVLAADSPIARKFIEARAARKPPEPGEHSGIRAEATGKALGRAFGKLFKK